MIKCFFVDVKSISSDLPRSTFAESDLEGLANLILETDGLLRPLVLKQTGIEQYTVIEGHREYYAALKAKEKDLKKAEMVNAFVINQKNEGAAIDQLKLLSEDRESNFDRTIYLNTKEQDIDRLLPALASIISDQLQPLTQQLSNVTSQLEKHKDMLKLLTRDSSVAIPKVLKKEEIIKPPAVTTKKVKEKVKLVQFSSVGAEIALDLINRLSPTDLSLNMQQARISGAVKLVTSIIAARNKQPDKRFDCWETCILEVKGLGLTNAKSIIDRLR